MYLNGGGDFEPAFAGCHCRAHIGRAHAGGERAERAVSAGMGVRADDRLSGGDKALFREKGVFNAHGPHVVIVVNVKAFGEHPALLALRRGFNILIGDEMVHYQRDPALVKDGLEARRLKFIDCHGGCNIVAEYQVQFGLNQLPGADFVQPRVFGQNFLRLRHSHRLSFPP